ncbi:ABC transporter permease [Bradyrhizobium sp.]|jgi:NitT/TauT family transport system permease protein|uniref:ABC transporter permease n=1 Tax=Bradyrhizobium sp. TaxID=376 RepID=UPI003C185D97
MTGRTQSRNALIPLAGGARRLKAYTVKAIEIASPYLFGLVVLSAWEIAVRVEDVPPYILPSPLLILSTLFNDFGSLAPSLWVTVDITLEAFAVSAVAGLLLALLFSSSRWIERTLFPYAIILQVTPIVAIAPLIIIWVKDTHAALLICATLVAFFPVVANAAVGLRSTDLGLVSLFKLYGANRWQTVFLLKLPAALPYYLAGLRIAGGLALIGAVVAEFVAGTGGTGSGLAYRILEASYRLRIPRLFAALVMISVTGIAIFAVLSWVSHFVLRRWHESSIAGD